MTIIATSHTAIAKALLAQGFFLVANLPKPSAWNTHRAAC